MGEMILIAAIALIVIGPEKFPDFAKIALRTMRDLRGYVDDIQNEVSKELKPLKKEIDTLSRDSQKYIDTLSKDTNKAFSSAGTTSSTTQKSQADPTDRQDDSFDYGSGSGGATNADGASGEYRPTGETPASPPQKNPDPTEEMEKPGTEGGEKPNQDAFDVSGASVERLD
ncbi:MAG: Sec-independent protein translocase protein TatB [Candidatus Hydrogenedentes bacterium ADurb.Bin101]|nr:MAG: Sec-independent protein translocase protein TatB [Candidatus Hydrogenedentes bacterium ADurb.Bin101]